MSIPSRTERRFKHSVSFVPAPLKDPGFAARCVQLLPIPGFTTVYLPEAAVHLKNIMQTVRRRKYTSLVKMFDPNMGVQPIV